MVDPHTIDVRNLVKSFGSVRAVDDLSFKVEPGRVTGFLGPNGAGKTTTLRALLGLIAPNKGSATIGGRHYKDLPHPARVVGAALEASSFHPGRSARDHLRVYAPSVGVRDSRCDEVLGIVGLTEVADRRVSGYSLGMRQRLALATTLLGDPPVLLLDEPANGLDPQGVAWLRDFLRLLAAEGRTVLVSSHVLAEVQQSVDDVVIIARGRLVHASDMTTLGDLAGREVLVAGPDIAALRRLVDQRWPGSASQASGRPNGLLLRDVAAAEVGAAAFAAGVELHELSPHDRSLEDVFLGLTADPGTDPHHRTGGTPDRAMEATA